MRRKEQEEVKKAEQKRRKGIRKQKGECKEEERREGKEKNI